MDAPKVLGSSADQLRSVNSKVGHLSHALDARLSESDVSFILFQEFLSRIASKEYPAALETAREILIMEPNNDMMKEYEVVLQERIAQLASGEGVDDDEDDSSSDEADEETDDESSESEEEEES